MIRDLSLTLQAILTQPGLPAELGSARIVFDAPTDTYKPSQTEIDLFLYDIRENAELRRSDPVVERRNGQAIIHPAPLRVACSYIVTAWPVGGADLPLQQHRLLSQVLQLFSKLPTIPATFLSGSLVGQEPPLPMLTAQTDGLKNPAEFWLALSNRPRPSIMLVVTISMPVLEDVTGPLVTTRTTGFGVGTSVISERLVQIGGRVLGAGGPPLSDAYVDIPDTGLQTRTDSEGRFTFSRVPVGTHTIRAVAVGFSLRTQPLVVPGQPEDYEVSLTPLP
jgi:Pvc16 N-terminal domain/Carboxypeptidase regulatory-like domain